MLIVEFTNTLLDSNRSYDHCTPFVTNSFESLSLDLPSVKQKMT